MAFLEGFTLQYSAKILKTKSNKTIFLASAGLIQQNSTLLLISLNWIAT